MIVPCVANLLHRKCHGIEILRRVPGTKGKSEGTALSRRAIVHGHLDKRDENQILDGFFGEHIRGANFAFRAFGSAEVPPEGTRTVTDPKIILACAIELDELRPHLDVTRE